MSKAEKPFFVHQNALVETDQIGESTRVWAFAHVMNGARIGKHCNICDHAFIESNVRIGNNVTIKNGVAIWDGVTLEDNVFVGPNAVFTNDRNPRAEVKKSRDCFVPTMVREGATIGANVTIVCGVEIGRYAFIGAGAVVTKDVEPHAILVGNPARKIGYMCVCGNKLNRELECSCGERFVRGANHIGLAPVPSSYETSDVKS